MKIIEWNINGRSTRKRQAKASKFIFDKLMDHNPDVIVLTEFVSASYENLETLLGRQNYSCFHSDNKAGNEILIAYKNNKFGVPYHSAFELGKDKPNYFNLNLEDLETGKRIVLGGVRVKIGGSSDLFQDFKSRRQQLDWLTNKLEEVEYSMLIIGDFNCGYYKSGTPEEEQTFVGKPREFYSYPLIRRVMNKNKITVTTPKEGVSWGNNFKLDHCLSKKLRILSTFYDNSFMKDPDYQPHVVCYPDHSQLVVTYDF